MSENIVILPTIAIKKEDSLATLNHEIMHLIHNYNHDFDSEWEDLNTFEYTENYDSIDLQKGFVTNYGMKKISEDIATIYEECMTGYYSANKPLYYDPIIIAKFRLLYKILISFDAEFKNIIENRNKDASFIYPRSGHTISIEFGVKDFSSYGFHSRWGSINTAFSFMKVSEIYDANKYYMTDNIKKWFEFIIEKKRIAESLPVYNIPLYPINLIVLLYSFQHFNITYDIKFKESDFNEIKKICFTTINPFNNYGKIRINGYINIMISN